MTDAFEDHEGTVSSGGRTITNPRFADDTDGLAGEEEEDGKTSLASRQSPHSLRHGDRCRENQAYDKQHQRHQRGDQSKRIEASDSHKLRVPGLSRI